MRSLPRAALSALGLVVAGLAPLVASVPLAAPASAKVTGSTSADDLVLYSHCRQHPISYDVAATPDTLLWRLEIQVLDPQGRTSEGTVLNSAANPPTHGTVYVTFCGSEPQGTYTVRTTGFYEVLPAVQVPVRLPDTTFQARPAATRTALRHKSLGHGRYRVTAQVREQDEHGFVRARGVAVRIERFAHGHWRPLPGKHLTTVHGRAVTTLTAHAGSRVRAVVPARHNYAGSVSRPVRL